MFNVRLNPELHRRVAEMAIEEDLLAECLCQ
ncbi:toxin-antitoxin system HicB family antitoxin [Escherichia coli]